MKKFAAAFFGLALFCSGNAAAQTADDIKKIENYLNGIKTMEARFVQTASNGNTAEGKFYIEKPNKIRMTYDAPTSVLFVGDGNFIVYNDTELDQVTHIDYDDIPASLILANDIKIDGKKVKISIHCAKPGLVIGKGGSEIEKVKAELQKYTDKKLIVDIKEVKRPDRDAQLVAENFALQLENRISFRRAMKSCMSRTMKMGALGIKACCSGRLGGADMARTEFYTEGKIPLQTLRANIDYGFAEANTTYGKVGVKVWVYHGEVLPTKGNKEGSDK